MSIPVVLDGDNVRAILAGKTTITIPLKTQPKHRLVDGLAHVTIGMSPSDDGQVWYDADGINPGKEVRHGFGLVGTVLWVKEQWARGAFGPIYRADYGAAFVEAHDCGTYRPHPDAPWASHKIADVHKGGWISASKMPKRFSRVSIEVVAVDAANEVGSWCWKLTFNRMGRGE